MAILPDNTKKLGFGLMRLPILNGNSECIDLEQVNRMADHFLAQGYTYFDTAYPYHMGFSERAVKSSLVERHPRDSFLLADKMPIFRVSKPEDAPAAFSEQLERTGAGYFDFYLLHAMSADRLKTVLDCQVWTYLLGEKARGRIRRLGFSFHDTPEVLDTILNALPEAEFVQLQINYADWEDEEVQARRCYEVAQKHGKPVIVMEPIRGGSLASEKAVSAPLLKAANPQASMASWALRFAADLPGVMMVLSGMSTWEQMQQNTALFNSMQPLSPEEKATLAQAADLIHAAGTIPCTGCQYCVEGCPAQINIPAILDVLNEYARFGSIQSARQSYGYRTRGKGLASACVNCGQCFSACPQHIESAAHMARAAELFE
ncbi:MAG: aldo/keto reductase [Clostridia bacterium]|nr:aldo/keto reductase [Clostridia bacterium]